MVRVWLVSRLVSVTVALGITAPEGSVSVPVSAPVPADWAMMGGANSISNADASVKARWNRGSPVDFIVPPRLFVLVSSSVKTRYGPDGQQILRKPMVSKYMTR